VLSLSVLPQQPTNLTATLIAGTTNVILSWTQSLSNGVTGYNLYRGTTSGGPYTLVTSVNAATFGFQDNTTTAGNTYFYVVTAAAFGGVESVHSNEASIVVP
jgi:fibronectin type 3 domain-containing protein